MTTPGNENDVNNEAGFLNPAADHIIAISNSLAHGEISQTDRYELFCMSSPRQTHASLFLPTDQPG